MNTAFARIQKDILECYQYQNPDSPPIFVKPRNDKMEVIDCLVVGPPDTPYECGFFHFEVRFTATYPNAPPKCIIKTTDGDKTRMNPNLYSTGKVCLSILGTWTGESADEWRSTYSLLYVLQAIQSLIMTQKPYHNEPGYEEMDSQYNKPQEVEQYSDKIQHEVLRVAVCGTLEDCIKDTSNPFRTIIKNQFLLWYDHYVATAEKHKNNDKQEFTLMPFEPPDNAASGEYNYTNILERLHNIKSMLEAETEQWKADGAKHTSNASGWRYLKLKDECEILKRGLSLEGVSAGPPASTNIYYHNGTIFGPEGSPWEGGIYNIEIVFSGEEDEPPRVRFTTEMFHPHITKDGTPFFPLDIKAKEPIQYVLKALFKLLKQPINSSPATWANVEAAKMFFAHNDPDQQREYKRRVARCVRNSVDT